MSSIFKVSEDNVQVVTLAFFLYHNNLSRYLMRKNMDVQTFSLPK